MQNSLNSGTSEAGFFFREGSFDFLSGKSEGNENGLAAAGGVGGQAGEAVASVN